MPRPASGVCPDAVVACPATGCEAPPAQSTESAHAAEGPLGYGPWSRHRGSLGPVPDQGLHRCAFGEGAVKGLAGGGAPAPSSESAHAAEGPLGYGPWSRHRGSLGPVPDQGLHRCAFGEGAVKGLAGGGAPAPSSESAHAAEGPLGYGPWSRHRGSLGPVPDQGLHRCAFGEGAVKGLAGGGAPAPSSESAHAAEGPLGYGPWSHHRGSLGPVPDQGLHRCAFGEGAVKGLAGGAPQLRPASLPTPLRAL